MGFLGLKSKKEVAEIQRQERLHSEQRAKEAAKNAKEAVLNQQGKDLSNLAKGSQIKIAVQYFDVFDPRFENFAVPVAVKGTLVYAIEDIELYKRINKTQNINDNVFAEKLKAQVTKYIKDVVTNAPSDNNIPVLQIERKILDISDIVQRMVTPKIESTFGINIRSLDISEIIVDKESRGYRELKSVTADLERDSLTRRHEMNLGGQEEIQRMQLENQRETMRIQREEMQRATRLQTESNFLSAHQANLNADVAKTVSAAPAAPAAQVAPAAPIAPVMPGAMPMMPGAVPQVNYMVGINGQQSGPHNWTQLQQLVQQGVLTQQTYVWKQGMHNWDFAGNVAELAPLFQTMAPGMPPMPPQF